MDCVFHYKKRVFKWKYKQSEEDDSKVMDDAKTSIANAFHVEISDMRIYSVKSESDLTKNKEISNEEDFVNEIYDGIDLDMPKMDFMVEASEMQVEKYQAKIDFTGINEDMKDETFEIIKCDFNDVTTWWDSWQEMEEHIGNVLKNENWHNSHCLVCTNNNMAINKVEDFINAFKEFNDSVSFHIAEKKVGATSKMFMIWNKIGGESLSYRYKRDEDMKSQFLALKKTITSQFRMKRGTKLEIKYNPYNDANSINITNKIDSNILSKDNMGQYWDLLENDEKASVMNFVIGDMNGKIAKIICVESLQDNKNALMLIKSQNSSTLINNNNDSNNSAEKPGILSDSKDDDIDWDIAFESQFLSFIKNLTNSGETDEDNVDYDELPFKIYWIKDSKVANEIVTDFNNNNNLINFDTIKSKYELEDVEVDSCDMLEECFENNKKECSFFIENKAYIMACHQNRVYFWKPSKITNDPDDIEWEIEYNKMKCDICKWFAVANDDGLKLTNMKDENAMIEDHEDMRALWEEACDDDDESCIKLKIEGTPLTKIVVDCSNVDTLAKNTIEILMALNASSDSDEITFNKFSEIFGKKIGNAKWQLKYELIDACNKPNDNINVTNAASFVRLYKTWKRKKKNIDGMVLRLETKFGMRIRKIEENGEKMVELDGSSSYQDLCSTLNSFLIENRNDDEKVEMKNKNNNVETNWNEYYKLCENGTNEEMNNEELFDNLIKSAKNKGEANVLLIFEPRYNFHVNVETSDSKAESISIPYFVEKIRNFDAFCGRLNEKISMKDWQNDFYLTDATFHGNTKICDSSSFHDLLLQCKIKHETQIFLSLTKKRVFCICVDLSDIDSEYKEGIEMKLYENELSDSNNFNKLRDLIDNIIGKQYETWKHDFEMIDSSDYQPVVTQSNFLQLLIKYGESCHELVNNVNMKFRKKEKKVYNKEQVIEELGTYQNMWSNERALSFDLENCDIELDFIHNNINNIRSCWNILTQECKISATEIEMSEKEKEGMKKRFDHLLVSMELEGHYRNSDVWQKIVESERDALKCQWDASLKLMTKVLNELRPFDIKKMLSLYDETLEAAKEVQNKDICLLVGHTGIGKSTTIHFMAGSTMVEDKSNGHIYPDPDKITNPALKKVKTEFKVAESVTRFISSVPISLKQAGIDRIYRGEYDSIELCDTPGFNDTAGPEVDVSNGLGIVKAVSGARRVKVLITIGYSDLDQRMGGLRDVGHTIGNLINGYKDYYENGSIRAIFTKMPHQQNETVVKALFRQGSKDLAALGVEDAALVPIVEQVLAPDRELVIVSPLQMKREDLLLKVFSNKSNKKNDWIESPSDVFQPFVTNSSLSKIKEQTLKHKEKIVKACGSDSGNINFSVIDSKLYDLMRLTEVLPDSQTIVNILKECMQHISQAWNKKCQRVMDELKRVDQRGLNDFKSDVDRYNVVLYETKQTEKLRSKYFSKHGDCIFVSEKSLYESLTNTFKLLLSQLTIKSDSLPHWQKMQLMLNVFGSTFSNQFNVKMNELLTQLKEIENTIVKHLSNDDFIKVNENLGLIGDCCLLNEYFTNHGFDVSSLFNNLVNENILARLRGHLHTIEKHFGGNNNGLESISDIKYSQIMTSCGKSCQALENGFNGFKMCQNLNKETEKIELNLINESQEVYHKCLRILIDYCESLSRYISTFALSPIILGGGMGDDRDEIESISRMSSFGAGGRRSSICSTDSGTNGGHMNVSKMNKIKPLIYQLISVRGMMNDVKLETCQAYYRCIEQIKSYLNSIRLEFDNIVNEIEKGSLDADYESLVDYVNILKDSNWIFELRYYDSNEGNDDNVNTSGGETKEAEMNELVEKVAKKMAKYMDSLVSETETLFIGLENAESMDKVQSLMTKLDKLSELQRLMPDIADKANHILGIIEKDVRNGLMIIGNEFNLKNGSIGNLAQTVTILKRLMKGMNECEIVWNERKENKEEDMNQLVEWYRNKIVNIDKEIDDLERNLRKKTSELEAKRNGKEKEMKSYLASKQGKEKGRTKTKAKAKAKKESQSVISSITKIIMAPTREMETGEHEDDTDSRQEETIIQLKQEMETFSRQLSDLTQNYQKKENELNNERKENENKIWVLEKCIECVKDAQNDGFSISQIDSWKLNGGLLKNEIDQRESMIKSSAKHGGNQVFDELNCNLANESLIFLKKCAEVRWRRSNMQHHRNNQDDVAAPEMLPMRRRQSESQTTVQQNVSLSLVGLITNTQSQLNEYISKYGQFRMNGINGSLDYLIDFAHASADLTQMREYSVLLHNGIQELMKIDENYKELMSVLNGNGKILSEFGNRVTNAYNLVRESMVALNSQHSAKLQTAISHCRALSKLDSFIGKYGNDKTIKFSDLAFDYSKELYSSDGYGQLLQAIEDTDFVQVGSALHSLQQQSIVETTAHGDGGPMTATYKQACVIIAKHISNELSDCKIQVLKLRTDVDVNQVTNLHIHLKRIKEARFHAESYLSDGTSKEISQLAEQVDKTLVRWVFRVLDGLKALIGARRFNHVETQFDAVRIMYDVLGNTIDKDGEMENKLNDIETQLTNQLKSIQKNYEGIKLDGNKYSPYIHHPPYELKKELDEVMLKRQIYGETWNRVSNDIMVKYRIQLDLAKKTSLRESQRILRLCESILRSLPDEMKEILGVELKHSSEDIANERERTNSILDTAVKNDNYRDMGRMYVDACYYDDSDLFNRIKRELISKFQPKMDNLQLSLKHQECQKIFDSLEDLLNIKNEFEKGFDSKLKEFDNGTEFDEKKNERDEFKNKHKIDELERCYHQALNAIYKALDTSVATIDAGLKISNELSLQHIEKEFEFVSGMIDKNRVRRLLMDKEFDERIDKLSNIFNKFFDSKNQTFKNAKDKLEIKSLEEVLTTIALYKPENTNLLEKLKAFEKIKASEIPQYGNMVKEVNESLTTVKNKIVKQGILNEVTQNKNFGKERETYYKELKNNMKALRDSQMLKQHLSTLDIDAKKEFIAPCVKKIAKDVSILKKNLKVELSNETLEEESFNTVNVGFQNLAMLNEFEIIDSEDEKENENLKIDDCVNEIKTEIKTKIGNWQRAAKDNIISCGDMANYLVQMEMAKNLLPDFSVDAKAGIDTCLKEFQTTNKAKLPALLKALESTKDKTWGFSLIKDNPAFEGQLLSIFNKKTRENGIDYVMRDIKASDKIDTKWLRNKYTEFDKLYQELVKQNLVPGFKLDTLVTNTIDRAHKAKSEGIDNDTKVLKWNVNVRKLIVEIMAHVFAIWTLQNATHYFDAPEDAKDDERDSYLMQPRTAQVISMFRILSIDDKSNKLARNLIEIGTGEGKSLTLAITSCVLALVGFNVSCACYSKYLSERDHKSFDSLFAVLGVSKYIMYGTFNKLCESVINDGGNVRELVEGMIKNNCETLDDCKAAGICDKVTVSERPKVLLIDEVDVFFNKEFYGNVYTPAAVLKDPCINNITKIIWNSRDDKTFSLKKIQETQEYKDLCVKFSHWTKLIDEAIKDMLFDVHEFSKSEYVVVKDEATQIYKIGYKTSDMIDTKAKIGYQTLFAYYHENEKEEGKVTSDTLNENIAIYLKCGTFSYAEIPSKFAVVLGVTGTLQTLSDSEKNIMRKEYGINKYTYMPSLFGANKFLFDKKTDVQFYEHSNYNENLKEEIKKRLKPKPDIQRCVFVFFENKTKLMSFYEYKEFKSYFDSSKILILTEETLESEKNAIIKSAARAGMITLMTRSFGRGTDFDVRDIEVANNGGPHVIQTFFSDENSEEKQIQGRTARQGNNGSYSMVLLDQSLDAFGMSIHDVEKAFDDRKLYDILNEKRKLVFDQKYEANLDAIGKAKAVHEGAELLVAKLKAFDIVSVRNILLEGNLGAALESEAKVAVIVDATGSMWSLLDRAKNTVGDMCDRISTILKEGGKDPKSFNLQFVAYRNYDAPPSHLLQYSGWCSDATILRKFLTGVEASYGWGTNEAVEIGFQHIIKCIEEDEDEVSDIILIGDAGCNTRDEVTYKRKERQSEWDNHDTFDEECYFEDQLDVFIEQEIPIHTFYLESYAQKDFETIAKRTGGQCSLLDVSDVAKSSQILTDLVSEKVLKAAGGAALTKAYEAKFGKFIHTS